MLPPTVGTFPHLNENNQGRQTQTLVSWGILISVRMTIIFNHHTYVFPFFYLLLLLCVHMVRLWRLKGSAVLFRFVRQDFPV